MWFHETVALGYENEVEHQYLGRILCQGVVLWLTFESRGVTS